MAEPHAGAIRWLPDDRSDQPAVAGTALIGGGIHAGLIRRLADRPLDTLLATWGLSLILQQAARDLFGAIGVEVRAPDWLTGSLTLGSVVFPSARLLIRDEAIGSVS